MKIEFKNTFGGRLEFLMKKRGINTTEKGANTKLARDMLKTKCLPFYVNEALKAQESARVRIGEHRKALSAESIEGKWLKAYCDYFGCSADFLFGYISLPTHDETNIEKETGLSKAAINKLQEVKMYNDSLVEDPGLYFINLLLEQLDPVCYNDILHEIAAYLRSDGLGCDMWYNADCQELCSKEYGIGKYFNFPIPAHSEMFDNLLLMDIQQRLRDLKKQVKKVHDDKK